MRPFKRARRSGRFSKRRFGGRRRFNRGYGNTGQWGRPSGFANFRARRVTRKQWRRILWRDSIQESHWRSFAHLAIANLTISTGFGNGVVYMRPAITVENNPYHTLPFWTVAGGAQQLNEADAVPLFKGDITLRGGICRIVVTNSDIQPVRAKVWAIWAERTPSTNVYNLTNAVVRSQEFDPSVVPDFHLFGKVLYKKEVLLLPGQQPFEVVHRLKVQKIDQRDFNGEAASPGDLDEMAGSQLWWCWQLIPQTENTVADNYSALLSFNLSFVADAIGTT